MSDITLPHPAFTDGNTLVADDVWENLYSTPAVANSYEVINGGLFQAGRGSERRLILIISIMLLGIG